MEKENPDQNHGMWKGAPPESFAKAQDLRRRSTLAENILWEKLRNHQFANLKFRRQHPIGFYIADFYCHAFKLVIEVDGDYHLPLEQQKKDQERTEYLISNGLKVIRFTNSAVENDCEKVLDDILSCISKLKINF